MTDFRNPENYKIDMDNLTQEEARAILDLWAGGIHMSGGMSMHQATATFFDIDPKQLVRTYGTNDTHSGGTARWVADCLKQPPF